jgi:hypothetical protein
MNALHFLIKYNCSKKKQLLKESTNDSTDIDDEEPKVLSSDVNQPILMVSKDFKFSTERSDLFKIRVRTL